MIGFVSALSSSLAVIILIMSVMMMNMMKSAMSDSQKSSSNIEIGVKNANVDVEGGKGNGDITVLNGQVISENDGQGRIILNPSVISQETLNYIKQFTGVKQITTYCTYGSNFDRKVSVKYTTFNVIAITRLFATDKVKIKSLQPKIDTDSTNRCYIDYE